MPRRPDPSPPSALLARRLREERLAQGLSARDLAARAGISHVTAAAAEHGRSVRASTLARLLAALPGLRAHEILGGEPVDAPASVLEWKALARVFGFEAEAVRLDARVDAEGRMASELVVEGLRPTRGSLTDPGRLVSILGAPLPGAALRLALSVAADPGAAGRTHALRLDGIEHSVSIPARLDGAKLRAVRRDLGEGPAVEAALADQSPHGRPFTKGACAWIDHPVRRLVLRVRFPADSAPPAVRVLAWPATLATAPGENVDTWHRLYPHAPRRIVVHDAFAELAVEHPPVGTCFALAWDAPDAGGLRASRSPVAVRPLEPRPAGEAIREVRTQAGLSRRQAARLMGVSPASIVEVERGRDPRLDLLARAVERLPGVSAAEIFPPSEAGEPSIPEVHRRQVLRHGVVADAERSVVRIAPSGDVTVETRREGLRALEPASGRMRLRLGPTRGLQTARRWDVESLDARGGDDETTVRVVGRGAGLTVHELRFLASDGRRPVTLVRRMTVRGQVAVQPDAAHATFDARGRRAEAVYLEPALPSECALLDLRFPRGYWPDEIAASTVPRACGPSFEPEDLTPLVHPEGLHLDVDRSRRRIVLEVQGPLVGLRYQVLWFVG